MDKTVPLRLLGFLTQVKKSQLISFYLIKTLNATFSEKQMHLDLAKGNNACFLKKMSLFNSYFFTHANKIK